MHDLLVRLRLESSWQDVRSLRFWNGLVLEIIGTMFMFTNTFVTCLTGQSPLSIGIATGFSVIALIYTFGPISGCHINPAVSLSFLVTRNISFVKAILYSLMQIIGAYLAAVIVFGVLNEKLIKDCAPQLESGPHGFVTELLLTYFLLMTVFMVKDHVKWGPIFKIFGPFAIGLVIVANITGFVSIFIIIIIQ